MREYCRYSRLQRIYDTLTTTGEQVCLGCRGGACGPAAGARQRRLCQVYHVATAVSLVPRLLSLGYVKKAPCESAFCKDRV